MNKKLNKNLTSAEVCSIEKLKCNILGNSLEHYRDLGDYKNILIIKSMNPKYIRLTLYPIKRDNITKVTIIDNKNSEIKIQKIMNSFKEYEIIHTSGLTYKSNKIIYECYFNLDMFDFKDKELSNFKKLINNINKKLKDIIVEEISISKDQY
ncbi:MAG: hypothetical protein GF317_01905 [Candidatus Lokiarchaeota archaeon]|jgi:hypothetical protein|nr:hypothetical protein [Candidatus Lokiarchaeota archaeon]MBD3198695.1 hypothetical protein [Candidatus Lokiarchaeota archaeon]